MKNRFIRMLSILCAIMLMTGVVSVWASAEEMAATLGLSRIHLNRKLKAEANTSPSTMLKEVRMKHARALLDEGKLSVAEISLACGFSTPSYFSTAFREYYGKTPSEYLAAL